MYHGRLGFTEILTSLSLVFFLLVGDRVDGCVSVVVDGFVVVVVDVGFSSISFGLWSALVPTL